MDEMILKSFKNLFDIKNIFYYTNNKYLDCDFFKRDEGIFFKYNNKKCLIAFKNSDLSFLSVINKKTKYIKILSIKNNLNKCIYQCFMLNAIYNDNIVLHCSSYIYNGVLFNFFGKSNSGKSTIIRFLKEKLGNNIYADDFLILKGSNPIFSGFYYKDKNKIFKDNTIFDIKYEKIVNVIIDSSKEGMNNKELIFYFLNNIHNTLINKNNIDFKNLTSYIMNNDIFIQKYYKDEISLKNILELVKDYDRK